MIFCTMLNSATSLSDWIICWDVVTPMFPHIRPVCDASSVPVLVPELDSVPDPELVLLLFPDSTELAAGCIPASTLNPVRLFVVVLPVVPVSVLLVVELLELDADPDVSRLSVHSSCRS